MNPLSPDLIAIGLLRYVVFLFSTTCHEASHALAAKLGGDNTAAQGGQVSLSPLPHIAREPFGMIVVPLMSLLLGGAMIGWASAPYDPYWQQRHPRRAALMSLAGPAANFALVLLAAILMHAGFAAGVFRAPESISSLHLVDATHPGTWEGIATLVSVLFSLNLLLGFFNLLPVPPLDGFGAVGLFLGERGASAWSNFGRSIQQYSFIGLLLAWQVFGYLYAPIFVAGLKLIYPRGGY